MAAKTTTNYGWTEVDPDGRIDVANDVNVPLEQIDASLKSVDEKAKEYTFSDGLKESSGNVSLDVAIRPGKAKTTATKGIQSAVIEGAIDGLTTDGAPYARAEGLYSHAEGGSAADGMYSHAEGYSCRASNEAAHAEGSSCSASGEYSHAEGRQSAALSTAAHAEGMGTTASGYESHAEGYDTTASGSASHAEGNNSKAKGYYSHAEGHGCTANQNAAHAEGDGCTADGSCAHAEGSGCFAYNNASHAEGCGTIAHPYQHAAGMFNVDSGYTSGDEQKDSYELEIIGNGTDNDKRSNARTLTRGGTQWTAGDVTCDAVQGTHDKLYSLRQVAAFVETLPAIEFGTSNAVTVPAVSQAAVDVTFGSAKTEAPVLFVNLQHTAAYGDLTWYVQSVTNQQASIVVVNNGSEEATGITVDWLAVSGR